MLVKQFKNSCKEICFNNVSDLYQQLTSLGSTFQRTTLFTHYSELLSMDASDYSCQFCNFCLKSFDCKNRICKQFSLKFLVRKFLLFFHNYVSLVFSTSTRRRNLVQMPIISEDGCNRLQHSGDSWKPLSIIAKNYFSNM